MILDEKKHKKKKNHIPSAQEQVGGKVNSGILFNMACGGLCEDAETDAELAKTCDFQLCQNGANEYCNVKKSAAAPSSVLKEGKEEKFDYKKHIKSLLEYMNSNGLKVKPYPSFKLDKSEQNGLFIKTGYYEPEEKRVTVFINDRHAKDVMRSIAHELVHHAQNLRGDNLSFTSNDNVKDNKELEKLESEAYLKGNIYFRKWTEYVQHEGKNTLNESRILEALTPDEVDLSSFNIKKALNKKFWVDEHLDSRIRLKLLDIADEFQKFLGVDWAEPEDVIMTGSLANFNWNKKYSDIDLHLVYDFKDIDKRVDFVKAYCDSKKKDWNETHDSISIYGFPVEVYVQDINEEHCSSGVYSLDKDEWIEEPDKEKLEKYKNNKELIRKKVSKFTEKIDAVINEYKNSKHSEYDARHANEKAQKIWDDIKKERKSGFSKSKSEMNNGNLIFKSLRRINYISKLLDLISETKDRILSLK